VTAQPSTAGRRSLLISAVEAGRLAWRAAPGQLAGVTATTLVVGAVPIAAAWLTKAVLDRIVAPGPSGAVVGLAVGLACAGVIGAVLPQLGQYLQGEADRRIGLHAQDELYLAAAS
jgi:ATP-binding cassette subfamily B protein